MSEKGAEALFLKAKRYEEAWQRTLKKALKEEAKASKKGWINVSVTSEVKEALMLLKQHYEIIAEKKGRKFKYDDLLRILMKRNPKTSKVLEKKGIEL